APTRIGDPEVRMYLIPISSVVSRIRCQTTSKTTGSMGCAMSCSQGREVNDEVADSGHLAVRVGGDHDASARMIHNGRPSDQLPGTQRRAVMDRGPPPPGL